MEGIVTKATGSWFAVRTEDGKTSDCKLKGRFRIKGLSVTSPVVVGDRVEVELSDNNSAGLIMKVYPRNNYIVRKSKKL